MQPTPRAAPAPPKDESTGGRCCRKCACALAIDKPAMQLPGMTRQQYDAMPAQQWVCRWLPPSISSIPGVLTQVPVHPDGVCWQFKLKGTLPGDSGSVQYPPAS